jgi:hypothetical protein
MLTLNAMAWSATLMAAGVELDFTSAGDVLRKGTVEFFWLRAPLDACLLPDGLRAEAHLLDQKSCAGVLSINGTMVVTGDREWGFGEE